MSFEPFNFNPALVKAIEQAKFTRASKIQQLVIPEVLAGKDILASAHSGSGKSASFVLPLIQKLLDKPRPQQDINEPQAPNSPRVLILTPTRELANQVSACIRRFTRDLDLRYGILVGGAPYPPQVRMLKRPVDFLVATPGRLLDHINNDRVNLAGTEYLVIDEINRMMDMNMEEDLLEIKSCLEEKNEAHRQTLIFSGSMENPDIESLIASFQQQAVRFDLARSKQSYRSLQQCMYIADEGDHKFKLVNAIISKSDSPNFLVYSNKQENLLSLIDFLGKNQDAFIEKVSGQYYSAGEKQIFLGLDENKLTQEIAEAENIQIIHLDLPDDILVFLQRLEVAIDRESKQELSILVGKDDWSLLHQIERYIGKTLSRKKIEGLEPESSEPSVGSKSSGRSSQTKNRNPYSGRRQNGSQNGKPKNKNGQQEKKNRKNKRGANSRNKQPGNNANQPNNNQFFADSHLDDRELSWKQYISNISSGKGNTNTSNKKYRKRKGKGSKANEFDINNSPMALSAKKVRDMGNDEWLDVEEENSKPKVQIKVKGQGKNKPVDGNSQEKDYLDADSERIEGKLGINK